MNQNKSNGPRFIHSGFTENNFEILPNVFQIIIIFKRVFNHKQYESLRFLNITQLHSKLII